MQERGARRARTSSDSMTTFLVSWPGGAAVATAAARAMNVAGTMEILVFFSIRQPPGFFAFAPPHTQTTAPHTNTTTQTPTQHTTTHTTTPPHPNPALNCQGVVRLHGDCKAV